MTATPAAPTAGPAPPGVVLLACWLLGGVAAARVVAAIGAFYAVPELGWHYAERLDDADAVGRASAGLILFGLVSLAAAAYLTLAILDGRGVNVARILTWVLCGLTICVCVPGLVVNVSEAVPWYRQLTLTTNLVTLAFAIAAVVLLALPAGHRFYRSRRRVRPVPVRGPATLGQPYHPYPPGYSQPPYLPPPYLPPPYPQPPYPPPQAAHPPPPPPPTGGPGS